MVTVHVWPGTGVIGSGGNVGHGAMTCGSTYISWWPRSGSVATSEAAYQILIGESTVPGGAEVFRVDCASEGNRLPQDYTFAGAFDEDAILDAWAAWQRIGTYNLTYRSCCACVVTLLIAGGLSRILPGSRRYYGSTPDRRPVVTPNDLATLARATRTSIRPERFPSMAIGRRGR
ncbi:hypothetical protein sS8_4546 [Methylocaldum marinum]|uniref:Uncharacterized protein n=1 Tax=Methylocaldum marinum TaxID=1432792 RepID=A0A250KY81_9GAMM|nr:hypothetical protein [Methylocaldum marinum]BBA36476.1 hypothetical protein sS8_4546 [Methylocaldum marinum]